MPRALRLPAEVVALSPITEGERNNTLFRFLMRSAPDVSNAEELITLGRRFRTSRLSGVFEDAEVEKTARSAWSYETRGLNRLGRNGFAVALLRAEIDELLAVPRGSDALALLALLRRHHGARCARGEPFAVACKAMARNGVIKGWHGPHKYSKALAVLKKLGFVVLLRPCRRVGLGRYEPALWMLPPPGRKSAPNVDSTLPFALSPFPSPRE